MNRFRLGLLSLMIVVALTVLAAWGYVVRRRFAELDSALKRRSAELDSALKRLSAEFASNADQHHRNIIGFSINLIPHGSFRGRVFPMFGALDRTPKDSERNLRYLEQFYGYGLTESDLAQRGLTKSTQARQILRLLWIRYELHMYFKYRRAAASPWLPVDPDPPVPPLSFYASVDEERWSDGGLQAKIAAYSKTFPNRVPE